MAIPTYKNPQIDNLLESIFGVDRIASVLSNKCATCGGEANEFRNELSKKEFRISGMCQKCQDMIFGE